MSLSNPIPTKRPREGEEQTSLLNRLKTSAGKIFANQSFLEIFCKLFFPDESPILCAQRIIDLTAGNLWILYVSVQAYMLDIVKYPTLSNIFVMLMISYMEYIFKYKQSSKVNCIFNGKEIEVQLTGSAFEGNVHVFFAGIFRLELIQKDGSLHYEATLRKELRLKIDDETVTFVVSEDDTSDPPNTLGQGVYGSVFKIPGTGNKRYVIKVFGDKKAAEGEWAFLQKISGKHQCLQKGLKLMTNQTGYFENFIISEYQGSLALHEIKSSKMKGKIPVQNIIHLFLAMSNGLRVVHENGFLHADIKPSNIILNENLKSLILIDFGIATPIGKNPFCPDSIFTWWFRFWGLFLQEKMMNEFNSSNCKIVQPIGLFPGMDMWAFFLTVLYTLSQKSCDFLGFCSMNEKEARENIFFISPAIKLMKRMKPFLTEKRGMEFVRKIYMALFNKKGSAYFIQILNDYEVDSSEGTLIYEKYLYHFDESRKHNPMIHRVQASFSIMRCEDPNVDISGIISELKTLFVEIVCDGGDFSLIGCFTNDKIHDWLCRLTAILSKMNALNKRIFFY
jgi:hypothetical protein